MASLQANGIEIEYEEFGNAEGRPLLLIMGLGAQMTLWDEEFCEMLSDRGHWVIRFDNRDVGLSTKFEQAGVPDVAEVVAALQKQEPTKAPYLLSDMADDAAGLLDALGIESAHIVGASMGGMIAQAFAIEHPRRALSLTSIMATTGHPELPPATPEAMAVLTAPPTTDRAENIERSVASSRVIGSPGFPRDEARIRERAGRSFDRCFYPEGTARQMAAVVASGSRREALAELSIPTLVIHGKADLLVPSEGGLDTHAAIPGAQLMLIEGMGHDLPPGTWPPITDAITKLTQQVT